MNLPKEILDYLLTRLKVELGSCVLCASKRQVKHRSKADFPMCHTCWNREYQRKIKRKNYNSSTEQKKKLKEYQASYYKTVTKLKKE